MSQTEEDIIVLNVSTDTSGKTVVVKEQSAQNVIIVSPEAASIPAGPQGPPGQDGQDGQDGQPGLDGQDGQDGADGTSVNIVGNYTDSNGNAPSFNGVNSGDGYLNNFDGHLWVWSGASWTDVGEIRGPQGLQGDLGLSAYQVWLGENNNGTEQDFLDSIVGATGATGATGPAGADGESETLSSAIDIFLPNGGNFGQFSSGEEITVGDGTKTAIDIIREALVELGQIGQVSFSTVTPGSVDYSKTSISSLSVSLTASVANTNHTAPTPSTVSFEFFKKVGQATAYGSSFQTVSASGATATATVTDTLDFAFATTDPTNEWIYFKVVATDSQNSTTTNAEYVFNPSYSVPLINGLSANTATGSGESLGSSLNNRTRFNGESVIRFRVQDNSPGVDLDKARIYYDNGSGSLTPLATVDLSVLPISNGYTSYVDYPHDAGFVEIGSTNSYTVKIFDGERPYVNDVSNPCDTGLDGYSVNRIPIHMVLSSTALTNTSSDSDWQDLYDGTTSGTTVLINEQLTSTGDFLDANTDQLFASFTVPNSQSVGDYIYWFVPTYFFSASAGGTQDITGTSNVFIDLFHNYNDNPNAPGGLSNVIQDPGVIDTDYTLFKSNLSLETRFGNSSNTTPYIGFRIKDALGGTALRGTKILIRNNE